MRCRDSSPKGAFPSKACRTMPSRRSPSERSRSSARAFSTFRRRFSMRTPVCVRSTTRRGGSVVPIFVTMVHMYHGCPAAGYPREKGPRRFEEDLPADAVARRLHRLQHAPHDLVEAELRRVEVDGVGGACEGRLRARRIRVVALSDLALDGVEVRGQAALGEL